MGGRPLTALTIIGFPIETVDHRVMTRMLRGGMDKMNEAGVAIVGGHSINDKEPKFGYAVTGLVSPSRIVTNSKARPGDVLVLTKPLGVGAISFAGQMGMASPSALAAAAASMTELNSAACEAMIEMGVEAAIDVTGFGLLGHLGEMAIQSGVTAEVYFDYVPILEEAADCIRRGAISGGVERNAEHSFSLVVCDADVTDEMTSLLYDPQTSGGLLICVPQEKAGALLASLADRGVDRAAAIGRILPASSARIHVRRQIPGFPLSTFRFQLPSREETTLDEHNTQCCCSGENFRQ